MSSNILTINSVGTLLTSLSFSDSSTACAPSSCGIFVKKTTKKTDTSTVTKSAFSGSSCPSLISSISLKEDGKDDYHNNMNASFDYAFMNE